MGGSLDGIAFQFRLWVVTMIEAQQEGVHLGQGSEVLGIIQGVFLVAVGDEANVVIGGGQVELRASALSLRRW